jgi:hypothetical protein
MTPFQEYEKYLEGKKPGENMVATCKRLRLKKSRVSYYVHKNKTKAKKTKSEIVRQKSKPVVVMPLPEQLGTPAGQVLLVITDARTALEIMQQKGY